MIDAIWEFYQSSPRGDIENSGKSIAWQLQDRSPLYGGDIFKVSFKFISQSKYLARNGYRHLARSLLEIRLLPGLANDVR